MCAQNGIFCDFDDLFTHTCQLWFSTRNDYAKLPQTGVLVTICFTCLRFFWKLQTEAMKKYRIHVTGIGIYVNKYMQLIQQKNLGTCTYYNQWTTNQLLCLLFPLNPSTLTTYFLDNTICFENVMIPAPAAVISSYPDPADAGDGVVIRKVGI